MRYCTNCGTKLSETDKFCYNCGEKIIKIGGLVSHENSDAEIYNLPNEKQGQGPNPLVNNNNSAINKNGHSNIFLKLGIIVILIAVIMILIMNRSIFNSGESYESNSDKLDGSDILNINSISDDNYSSKVTEEDGEFGEILKRLTPQEVAFYRKVVATYNPDPANKLGQSCGDEVAKCEWCGNEFRYTQYYQSRVEELKQASDMSPILGLGLSFAKAFGGLTGEDPVEKWSNEIKEDLKQIRKNRIYYCGGEAPKYCSEKCRIESSYHR